MIEYNQKAQQIMNALQMQEQEINPANPMQIINKPLVTGEDRQKLISELVKVLTDDSDVVTV
jgi:hypothetical protein